MASGKVRGDAPGAGERLRRPALPATKGDGRAGVRTDQAQPAHQPVPATRTIRRTLGMAADYRHAQPLEAPQAPLGRPGGLKPPYAAGAPAQACSVRPRRAAPSTPLRTQTPPASALSDTHDEKEPRGAISVRQTRQSPHPGSTTPADPSDRPFNEEAVCRWRNGGGTGRTRARTF